MNQTQMIEMKETLGKRARITQLRRAITHSKKLDGIGLIRLPATYIDAALELLAAGDNKRTQGLYNEAWEYYENAWYHTVDAEAGPKSTEMVLTRLERLVRDISEDQEFTNKSLKYRQKAYKCADKAMELIEKYQK